MKKIVLMCATIVFAACLTVQAGNNLSPGSPTQEVKGSHANEMVHALLMYIPNRLVDATDIFTISAGMGGHFAMDVHLTQYFQLGGWSGPNYFITKGYARQYGGGYQHGYEGGLFCFNMDQTFVDDTFGTVREYYIDKPDFSMADFTLDAYRENSADFWAIGVSAGWLFNISVNIHPLEIADFISGLVFYDIMGDDF